MNDYDVIVIGAGIYGCMIALNAAEQGKKVLIVEKENDILTKASAKNQARVHNGYHYPRDFLTLSRSHENYKRFCEEFKECVEDYHIMLYAIAKDSKTTVENFKITCKKADIPLISAPRTLTKFFSPDLIEAVFVVEEDVFSVNKLRKILMKKLDKLKVDVWIDTRVFGIAKGEIFYEDDFLGKEVKAKQIICCAYAGINDLLEEKLPVKHEYAYMPLIEVPDELKHVGITIMDGDYFAIMPYPDTNYYTLHHVKYTPDEDSSYEEMITDAARYIPTLRMAKHKGDLHETKVILLENEETDARPILYRKDYPFKGFDIVLGSKLDNVYDVIEKINNPTAKDLNIV